MSQQGVGDLDRSVGYVVKQVQATLHAAMDEALRPFGLTVAQYACLELLGQRPGLSNAELARLAFVTRQSMNLVLRRLQERGLLSRPEEAAHGRARPTTLTTTGRSTLRRASSAVRAAESDLFSPLSPTRQREVHQALASCLPPREGTR